MASMYLRKDLLVIPEAADPTLIEWLHRHEGMVFRLRHIRGNAYFHSLGPEDDACRLPINITSRAAGTLRLVSNFSPTPFVLDGAAYGSVEGFWQSIKFTDMVRRSEVAMLHGATAKDAGFRAPESETILYGDGSVRVGTWEHWALMERACMAKFEQDRGARDALLGTGDRPLVHQMRRDSRTIPGVIMAAIWMRCRTRWREA